MSYFIYKTAKIQKFLLSLESNMALYCGYTTFISEKNN